MKKHIKLVIPGVLTGLLIVLFLTGKIIDIPHGTKEGGIIGGVGVLVIIIFSVSANYLYFRLTNSREKK
jgi:hypothetical protein